MKYNKLIEGKNIHLRDIRISDCTEQYVEWLNNADVNKYLESRLKTQTIESVTRYVLDALEASDKYMFAIIFNENNKHIGNVKIDAIHEIYRNAIAGYMIGDKNYWNKGLGSEAVRLALEFCFYELALHKVSAGIIEANTRSKKLLEKLGFKKEACIRDDIFMNGKFYDNIRYGILKEEFTEMSLEI